MLIFHLGKFNNLNEEVIEHVIMSNEPGEFNGYSDEDLDDDLIDASVYVFMCLDIQ